MGLMPLRARLKAVETLLLDLVFPRLCFGCGAEGHLLCPSCSGRLNFLVPACPVCSRRNFTGILCPPCARRTGLRRFLAPFSYANPIVRELIHGYKYEGVRALDTLLAQEIAAFMASYGLRPKRSGLLVPIPLHRTRERERGFNQAQLLARDLARRWGLVVAEPLSRRRWTEPQIEMDTFDQRRANMAGAFRVAGADAVRGRIIILIDDVSTSGATLSEAAKTLREAGARSVWAIAVAKG